MTKSIWRNLIAGAFWSALTVSLAGCGGGSDSPVASIPGAKTTAGASGQPAGEALTPVATVPGDTGAVAETPEPLPRVLVKTSAGDFTIELNDKAAPATVDNFLTNYVDQGFYADTVFHHVESGFVAITGGYLEDLTAKETGPPIPNEAGNGLKNGRGTVAMARVPEYSHSATSQFWINLADNTSLDYDVESENDGYCVFGEVVAGMDVIDRIAASPVQEQGGFPSVPVEPVVIHSVERIQGN